MTKLSAPVTALVGAWLATMLVTASPAGAARAGLVLNPPQGPPNSTVSFTGSGFCGTPACGAVVVTFNNVVVANNIHVSPQGTITGAFYVPSGPNGSQRVVATQAGANISATALYFVGTALPPPTGPQPTVNFTPATASVPVVHTTGATPSAAQSASRSVSQPASPAVSSAGQQSTSSPTAAARSTHTSNAWWWLLAGAIAVLAAIAAAWAYRRVR